MGGYECLDDLPVAIFIHDDTQVRYANGEALRMLGATSIAELAACSVWELLHRDIRAVAQERARLVIEHRMSLRDMPVKFRALDGDTVYASCDASSLETDGEVLVVVVGCTVSRTPGDNHGADDMTS
ncbi:MAG: PAS domain S-box protein [Coriobacteriia bacterium]|nr:PAS domain S-box protein [Coriobacteriia bacterium]